MRTELSSMQQELQTRFAAVFGSTADDDLPGVCAEHRWLELTAGVDEGLGLGVAEGVLLAEQLGYALRRPAVIDQVAAAGAVASSPQQLWHSSYLIGIARRAIGLAVDYAQRRRQFDEPISQFQAVMFPLAEDAVRIHGLQLRSYQLAADVDRALDRAGDIEVLNRLVRRTVFAAVGRAVHVHGARGLTDAETISRCHRLVLDADGGSAAPATQVCSRARGLAEQLSGTLDRRIPAAWRDTVAEFQMPPCVHQLVGTAARRHPDEIAVQMADEPAMSYRELDERSNRLARILRSRGVTADSVVAICLTRCVDMIVALLGVLKAGGAYLPLDPEYPPDRLEFMLKDSHASIVITQRWFTEWLPGSPASVLEIDTEEELSTAAADPLPEIAGQHNLVYVIYTSGSTGTPKGVEIEHRGLVNRLAWDREEFPLGPGDAVLQHTSFSFDIAAMEIFGALINGARLVLAPPGTERDTALLARTICQENITALPLVPSVLDVLLEEKPGLDEAASLRYIFSGGEALSPDLCHRVFTAVPWAQLHNFYGPSEATIDVTSWHCTPDSIKDAVPIGRPLANVRVYIVDDYGVPVPAGFPGELLVGGVGVARGYRFRPDLTASRFLPNPFAGDPAPTVYRTGDLARYRDDGSIEFLGRVDEQVKINGFRIEPGEIEFVLQQLPGIRQALVKPVGNARLEAYVVSHQDGPPPSPNELLASLRQRLPGHMVPGYLEVMPDFPRLPNGKIDRNALVPSRKRARRRAEDGSITSQLTELMAQVLNQPDADPHASFFDLGGTSLQAARLVARVRNRFGGSVSLGQFVDDPTCAGLARRIEPDSSPEAREDK